MRWVVVKAILDSASVEATGAEALIGALTQNGHHVDVIDVLGHDFEPCMSADEHREYEEIAAHHPDSATAHHIELLRSADGLAFVFPSLWMTPAPLKGWMERTLLPDVAFRLDPNTRLLKPELTNIRHLAVVTSSEHAKKHRLTYGDPTRRLLMRSIRAVCHRRCKTSWMALHDRSNATDTARSEFVDQVRTKFEAL